MGDTTESQRPVGEEQALSDRTAVDPGRSGLTRFAFRVFAGSDRGFYGSKEYRHAHVTIKLLAGSALGSLVVAAVALFAVWNNRYETSLDSSGEGWSRYWYLLAVGLFLLSVLCAIGAYVRRAGALREYDDRADDERKQASRLEWDKAIADADPGLANLISANRKIL